MNEKCALWRKLTTLIAAVASAVLGSDSSKALSVEHKPPAQLTIEKRLEKIRERIKIEAKDNNDNSQTSPLPDTELIKPRNDYSGGREEQNPNHDSGTRKRPSLRWNKNGIWPDWANWADWKDTMS